ncbi:protein of unknown function [Candidatus Nitrosotalea okcheonensis]|uniref:Uncharacterized protein n=1 Tax=Candidatus Nitrosotalea okcheonensis TaxID=1903276 RepID=A0A2H1FHX0_9ARCH|nr:protein of unknown function [Candidatus Nitrosotalea okcheonensis]
MLNQKKNDQKITSSKQCTTDQNLPAKIVHVNKILNMLELIIGGWI